VIVNSILLNKNTFCLTSLTAFAILASNLPAKAQSTKPAANSTSSNQVEIASLDVENVRVQKLSTTVKVKESNTVFTPIPGSVATSSLALTPNTPGNATSPSTAQTDGTQPSTEPNTQPSTEPNTQPSTEPSTEPNKKSGIKPGRATRGGSSYIGIGGNIGLTGGSSSLSDGDFSIISKIGFTRKLSFRPSAVLGDNATVLLPVTLDFTSQRLGDQYSEPLAIAPYVGVGAAIKTGSNSDTAVLVTGGIDVPLNAQFTANVSVSAGFFNQTDVGLILGVGYNFPGL